MWTAIGVIASLIGLFAQHLWFRHEISVAKRMSSKGALVERPIENALECLATLEQMSKNLRLGRTGANIDEVKSHGGMCSRKVSSAVNLISRYNPTGQAEYEKIASDDLVESLESLEAASIPLSTRNIEQDITRIRIKLERCLADLAQT